MKKGKRSRPSGLGATPRLKQFGRSRREEYPGEGGGRGKCSRERTLGEKGYESQITKARKKGHTHIISSLKIT